MTGPTDRYLEDWNQRTAKAIFESDMARWIENELGGWGLPDSWEIDQ